MGSIEEKIDRPEPGDDDILIGIRTSSVTISGPFKPRNLIPGTELARDVETIGKT